MKKHNLSLRTSDVRNSNLLLILQYVRNNPIVTKTQISEALGLSRPTVNYLLDELIQINLLQYSGIGVPGPSGGKPPTLIKLNEKAGYILGVSLSRKVTSLALSDLSGKIIDSTKFSTKHLQGPESWYKKVKKHYDLLIKDKDITTPIIGAGIAITGLVDSQKGILTYSAQISEWVGVPIVKELTKILRIPIYIEREASAYAVYEKVYGLDNYVRNFVTILCDEGVGAGIFINGKLYQGANGAAGEIGHSVVDENGLECYCGNRGCLETIISIRAIIDYVRKKLTNGEKSILSVTIKNYDDLSIRHIANAIKQGDYFSIQIARLIGKYLGKAVGPTINMYNPEKVVLCGEVMELGEELVLSLRNQVNKIALPMSAQRVHYKVIDSKLLSEKQNSHIAGASLVINELFSNRNIPLLQRFFKENN